MYLKVLTVGPVETNCYLLGDEDSKQAAVIDPGESGGQIYDLLTQDGYTPVMILLTHGHFDHVNGVRDFLAKSGSIPVYLSQKDYPYSPTRFHAESDGIGLGELKEAKFVSEGDTISLGKITIQVLETPGHTGGGLTFKTDQVLFTGDTLFAGSCGRTDFSNSDQEAMWASLRRLAQLEGNYTVCPGHGGCTSLEQERKYNMYLHHALSL
jgi:glyoxylase-like metal-dependent hydrolase (beta-lactamase superfamily II)